MAELLSCPFCGDNNARVEGAEFDMFIVSCDPRSGCGACTEMVDDIAAAVAAWNRRAPPTDASRAEDAWISVAERLGPPHQNVLCLNRDGNVFTGRVCYGMHKPFWTLPRNYDDPSNTAPSWIDVTHWMPLPAPPARALATDGDDRG